MAYEPLPVSAASEGDLLSLLAENLPDCALLTVDADGRVQTWTRTAERLLGYSAAEILGQPLYRLWVLEHIQVGALEQELQQALSTGRSEEHRWFVRKDGSRFWASDITTPLRSESGELRGFARILRDRTDLKLTETALQESEARLRSVVQSNMIGIGFWDSEGFLTDANDLLLRMIGYRRDEILGRHVHWSDLTPPELREGNGAVPPWAGSTALDSAGAAAPAEREWIRRDGTRFPILIGGAPLEGDPTRGSFWAIDISEQKKAEKTLHIHSRVLESMAEGVLLTDEKGTILYTNPAQDAIFGYERGELVGQHVTVQNAYPAEENARIVGEVLAQLRKSGMWRGQFHNRKKDGTLFLTQARITAVELDGRPHWVCVQEDITERARTLQQLATSEERLRLAMEAVRMGTWDWNIQTNELIWSENLISLHGLTPEQFDRTADTFLRVIHPDDLEMVRQTVQTAIEQHTPYDAEFRIVWPDGRVRWMAGKGKVFYDEHGQPTNMVGIGIDITEHREAADRLRASEQRFRALMEQAPFSIQIFSPDGRTLRVNRTWEALWGITFDRLADYNLFTDPQLEAKGIIPYLQRAAAGESIVIPAIDYDPHQIFSGETLPEMRRRWVAAVAYPLKNAAGEVQEVVLFHEDITARKQAEDALRESEERYRGIISQSIAGFAEMDVSGRFLMANDRYCEILGRTREELLQLRLSDVSHPDDLAWNVPLFEKIVRDGEPYIIEKRYLRPDGTVVWVNNSVSGMRGPDGQVKSVVAVCVDVTARQEAEEALRHADRRKDEFLAMLGHELRNPLAPIRSGLELLDLEQPGKELIGLMREQVDHLVRLVDDLLDVSRIMRGKIELRKQPVELAKVLSQAIETARPLIDGQHHELTRSLPAEPIWLEADPVRLTQVFANLLNNSAKYTLPSGHLWMTAEVEGEQVTVHIRDNGIGIEPELLPHVFDLFTQGDRAIDRSQGGLGIGLTVVKSLVEMHDGTVSVRSEGTAQGSEFIVRLPILSRDGIEHAVQERSALQQGYRILAVDDNRAATTVLRMLLMKLGPHDVTVASDGPGALAAIELTRPQLVLLDIGLPGMSGIEVARQIRANPENAGILLVALTGYGTMEDRHESRAAGFDEHLVKPADIEVLRRLLEHPKLTGGE